MSDEGKRLVSEAAASMGRIKSEKKAESSRENFQKATQKRWEDPEARKRFGEAIRAAARRRREAKAEHKNDN